MDKRLNIVDVASVLVGVGYNAENASIDNPQGVVIGERFFVQVESEYGGRIRHSKLFESEEAAKKLADRVQTFILMGGSLNMDHWSYADPVYGSDAYCDQGIEQERAQYEKEEELGFQIFEEPCHT